MKKLDFEIFNVWCGESGYRLEAGLPYLTSSASRLDIPWPAEPSAVTELLDDLVNLEPDSERVVWIRDWTIWDERSEQLGLRHLELLAGRPSPVAIYALDPGEIGEAIALLSVPALWAWDAHLLFRSGVVLVSLSHHGSVSVVARSEDAVRRLRNWAT